MSIFRLFRMPGHTFVYNIITVREKDCNGKTEKYCTKIFWLFCQKSQEFSIAGKT